MEHAVKATENDLELMVLGAPYGVDRVGHEFHAGTDFGDLPIVPVIHYHGWGADDGERIGWATKGERDGAGQWYRVVLDATKSIARTIYEDAKRGMVRASSDAIGHLVRPENALKGYQGRIDRWVIGALSLMDAATHATAINPRAIAMPAVRAMLDEIYSNTDGQPGEAIKAGAVFARRNRERIEAMRKALDEMLKEFLDTGEKENMENENTPQAEAAKGANITATHDLAGSTEAIVALAVKAALEASQTEQGKREAALKAEFDAKLTRAIDAATVASKRPTFAGAGADSAKAKKQEADEAHAAAATLYARSGGRDTSGFDAVKATMNVTTTTQGGFLVPDMWSNELIVTLKEMSLMRAAGARVRSIMGTDTFKISAMTESARSTKTAESAAFTQTEPTVSELTITPFKYTRESRATFELLASNRFDTFNEILRPDAANAFVLGENDDFTVGDGSGDPQGAVVGSSLGKTAAAIAAVTFDELHDLYRSLGYLYRANGKFMMTDATLGAVAKLKDTTNQYLLQANNMGEPGKMLFGKEVVVNNNMAALATGNKTILFGNFDYFGIFDFPQLSGFKALDQVRYLNGEVVFAWHRAYDSRVLLSTAIKHLIQA